MTSKISVPAVRGDGLYTQILWVSEKKTIDITLTYPKQSVLMWSMNNSAPFMIIVTRAAICYPDGTKYQEVEDKTSLTQTVSFGAWAGNICLMSLEPFTATY